MGNCVICDKETKKGFLCLDHYKQTKEARHNFDKNQNKEEFETNFKKLKNQIFFINKIEYAENASINLIAIAELIKDLFNDNSFSERVYKDIESLLTKKREYLKSLSENKKKETSEKFNDNDFRKQWSADFLCDDGHYVRSKSEQAIDNWLYSKNIVHAYEKSIFMENDPDAVVLCDFYIKEIETVIEFWGLDDDEKYLKRKEEKINLYESNRINLINLDENSIKRLDDILPRQLNKMGLKNKKL